MKAKGRLKTQIRTKGTKRMNRKELVKEVAFNAALNMGQVETVIKTMKNRIEAALMRGESVELTGFGKFEVVDCAARKTGDPLHGGTQQIPAKRRVKFRPGAGLKRAVAG